jgi:hypothetical protein
MPDAKVVLIDLQPRSITLQKAGDFFEGKYSLNLSNSRGVGFAAYVQIRPGETKAEWISLPADRARFDFPADKSVAIPIEVKIPVAAAGKNPTTFHFKVVVVDMANPDELYDTRDADFVVPAADRPPPPPPPRWLIPAIIVAAILVVGGVSFALYKAFSKPHPEEPKTPPNEPKPPPNQPKPLANGEKCDHDADCASSHCVDGKCAANAPKPAVKTVGDCVTRRVSAAYTPGSPLKPVCASGELTLSAGGFCPPAGRMMGVVDDGQAGLMCTLAGEGYWYGMCCKPQANPDLPAVGSCVTREIAGTYTALPISPQLKWMEQTVCQPNEIAVSAGGSCRAGQMVGVSTTNLSADRNVWLWCGQPGPASWSAMCCQPRATTHKIGNCTPRTFRGNFAGATWMTETTCQPGEIAVAAGGSCGPAGPLVGVRTEGASARTALWCSRPGPAVWDAMCCQVE